MAAGAVTSQNIYIPHPLLFQYERKKNKVNIFFSTNECCDTMGKLLPTLKDRKRYMAFEVLADASLSWESIRKAITLASKNYIGLDGMANAGLQFVKNNGMKGIVRMNHDYLNTIRASLLFIREIDNQKVIVKSIRSSGILNKVSI
jgi:ribonuclease P/MRP protein subunit POP5